MLRRIILLSASVVLLSTQWAHADRAGPSADDIKAAGEEFDLGKRAFKQRSWVEAAEHFEKADARAPSAVALDLAMRSRDKAGQLDRAAMLAALIRARHADQAQLVKAADAILKQAKSELHQVTVHCTPACDVVIGTTLVHGAPASERTLYLAPGGAAVHAGWPGDRTRTAPVKAVKGGSSELSFEAPPEPPREPATTPTPATGGKPKTDKPAVAATPAQPSQKDQGTTGGGGLPPLVFFVGAGLTAVAGGITIWSGLDTQSNPGTDTVREKCAGKGTSCPEYQDGLSRQKRTNVLLGVTAGLGVATGVVGALFTDWSGGKKAKDARLEPWVGVGALGARGRF